tara:strand:+ start:344 stop:451 length:108 start_codon:yes stop_codon:yes gene_type:complete
MLKRGWKIAKNVGFYGFCGMALLTYSWAVLTFDGC